MKGSNGIELLKFSSEKVLKRYRKRFSKMRGNPVSRFLCLWFTMSCAITLFALQITHFLANGVVSLPFVCTANFH